MFAQRETKPTQAEGPDSGQPIPFLDEQQQETDPVAERDRRHAVLMECLNDERDRQAEERQQAAIDEDFYDHLQWRQDDAQVLMERGQAPLVFNQARQTIDWLAGTQERMRKDYKILGREQSDEKGAEIQTQIVKYTDDVNLTDHHVSKVFKQSVIGGLSWLEEGLNIEPDEEIIFAGSEDWRNVYRDSRNKDFDLKNARYLFRRKQTDVDYAMALLPKAASHLRNMASAGELVDEDDVWYLGERLTGASDLNNGEGLPSSWRDRRAVIGNDYTDRGRRASVELLECWYRVPEAVQMFNNGPLQGKTFNPADPGHVQQQQDGYQFYDTVKMRMRVMVATKDQCLWDGPSPFNHGRFLLVPVWGYRRYRDGMSYGAMRGMRDLQEDTNKRASKALWLLSGNRMIFEKGAFADIEEARSEAARADAMIEVGLNKKAEFVKSNSEVQGNLEMMDRNVQFMRDVGGVTNANLGRGATGQSGISVERQQDQGSLTTSELFRNLRLARILAGKLRLSHIKQFKTAQQTIRITGEAAPTDYLTVNQPDPANPGQMLNDITQTECDFIVAEQDFRESYVRAATAEMFALLGQIATFAPQVVLSVLDLAVEGSEVRNKDEWIARIRKLNGQRDPTKQMTPEEASKAAAEANKAALLDKIQMDTMQATLAKLQSEVQGLDVKAMGDRVDAIFAMLQAAQIVATTPAVAPIADEIGRGAGFKDEHGEATGIEQPAAPVRGAQPPQMADDTTPMTPNDPNADPAQPMTPDAGPPQQEGANAGIQTMTPADNVPPNVDPLDQGNPAP